MYFFLMCPCIILVCDLFTCIFQQRASSQQEHISYTNLLKSVGHIILILQKSR